MSEPPDTPEHHKRMARIYLFEARRTIHRDWAFTLLEWAALRRRLAQRLSKLGPAQSALF
jgi:hypothetical protein